MELWFTERHTDAAGLILKCRRTICSCKSRFQRIDIQETEEFGRMLLLDGLVMTTEGDEFIYHEMLVHPAMHIHPRPENVLVIGGGDGGAVRELLKYPQLQRISLCEIDQKVVQVSKEYLPGISSGLSDTERLEITFCNGAEFLQGHVGSFDCIFVDSTDPVGTAKVLFTLDFYNQCFEGLKRDGILITQSESPFYHLEIIKRVQENLKRAGFPVVRLYVAPVPTYPSGYWSWSFASKLYTPEVLNRKALPEEAYSTLRYFTPEIHRSSFAMPAFLKKAL